MGGWGLDAAPGPFLTRNFPKQKELELWKIKARVFPRVLDVDMYAADVTIRQKHEVVLLCVSIALT